MFFKMIVQFIKRNNQNILFFPVCFYYVFFIIPLILDVLVGRNIPEFRFYGFYVSYDNFSVELIYCLGVLFNMLVYYRFFEKHKYELNINVAYKYRDIIFLFTVVINIIFILYAIFKLDNATLLKVIRYETRYMEKDGLIQIISTNALILGVMSFFSLLLEKKAIKFWAKSIVLFPFITFVCMCNGKKSIIFILVTIYLFLIYINKIIKSYKKYTLVAIFILVTLVTFYNVYLKNVVTVKSNDTFQARYASYRVEFGRDDTQKMVIYDELYDTSKILEYRGQSLIFYPTFFIEKENWANKPYPYATYFTAKLLSLKSVRYVGWNMTTSIYDELISNTGLLALFYTPFIISILCIQLMNKTRTNKMMDIMVELLGIFLICLAFAVQINAHVTLNLIFILLLMIKKITKIKLKRS